MRLPLGVVVAACVLVFAESRAEAAPIPDDPIFGIAFSIARESEDAKSERVVDDAWLFAQVDDANRFFTPLGARFRWTIEKSLAEKHSEMHSRADRDALTPLMDRDAVIDVFVVKDLEDVDEPGRHRMGVCWTGRERKRFIILSRTARPTVLAHELGHFFGNHQHSQVVNNLMSYSRDNESAVFLDATQSSIIKSTTRRFLESSRLRDVGPAWRFF